MEKKSEYVPMRGNESPIIKIEFYVLRNIYEELNNIKYIN